MSPELESERLAALLAVLREDREVEVAALFGSAASGRMRAGSDVDLYLRLAPGARWTPERERERRLCFAEVLGQDVDLVVEDRDATSVILRREVARRGRLLHEAVPGAWTRLKAEAMIAYTDLEPWLRRCGEGVRRAIRRRAEVQGG